MKNHENLTEALRAILFNYQRGYVCWTSFDIEEEKIDSISEKWSEIYGTKLPAYVRQDKKQKGLPTAVAVSGPVIGNPNKKHLILMATEFAEKIKVGPFTSEKWQKTMPTFSVFRLAYDARTRGDYSLTWKLNERTIGLLEKHLAGLVKKGDAAEVKREVDHWIRFYPMFGGIRRQLRRAIRGAAKLWDLTQKTPWPAQDPEKLPAMVGFNKAKV
jgi:hypothetical protein